MVPTGGAQGASEQDSPGAAQMPQLSLQHTSPELHRRPPQIAAVGYCTLLVHCVWSHVSPGAAHVPQLSLQQTWPELHCRAPHVTALGCCTAFPHCV